MRFNIILYYNIMYVIKTSPEDYIIATSLINYYPIDVWRLNVGLVGLHRIGQTHKNIIKYKWFRSLAYSK